MQRITYIQNNAHADLAVGDNNQDERTFVQIPFTEDWPKIDGLHAIQTYDDEVEVEWCCKKGLAIGNSNSWSGLPVGFKETLEARYQTEITAIETAKVEQEEAEEGSLRMWSGQSYEFKRPVKT